jgi:hypothetical protein
MYTLKKEEQMIVNNKLKREYSKGWSDSESNWLPRVKR